MRTKIQTSGQLFAKRWSLSNPNRTKSIMNKVKHHRNSDTKTGNKEPHQNHRLGTVSDDLLGVVGFNMFYGTNLTSVIDVVQTFSWLFGSHDNPQRPWTEAIRTLIQPSRQWLKLQIVKIQRKHMVNRVSNRFLKDGHSTTQTELKTIWTQVRWNSTLTLTPKTCNIEPQQNYRLGTISNELLAA